MNLMFGADRQVVQALLDAVTLLYQNSSILGQERRGICGLVREILRREVGEQTLPYNVKAAAERLMGRLMEEWPPGTGNYKYPIPHPLCNGNDPIDAESWYSLSVVNVTLWKGYGLSQRQSLMRYMIHQLQTALNKS